jgi:hypothetical protein
MSEEISEVIVEQIWPETLDRFLLDIRCSKGRIELGTTFTSSYELIIKDIEIPGEATNRTAVHFVVNRIVAYERDLDDLYEGMTAEITVTGSDLNSIKVGAILSSAPM